MQKIIIFFIFVLLIVGSILFFIFPSISLFIFLLYCFVISFLGVGAWIVFSKLARSSHESISSKSLPHQPYEQNPTLYSFHSVFPLDFFPDKYIIQEKTVSIVRKYFFFNGWAETFPIRDIGGVRLYAGPFFASLTLTKKTPTGELQRIELRSLWKKDALEAKEILDGLILKENKIVNTPQGVSPTAKKNIAQELGETQEVTDEI